MYNAVIGLVLLVLGAFGVTMWWQDFGVIVRGLIPFLLLIGGLVAIGASLAIGKTTKSKKYSRDIE